MKEQNKSIENSLIISEKENIFTRFLKWVTNLFTKKDTTQWTEEKVTPQAQEFTIPKAVKMPERITESMEVDENSLEYLYKLSDQELDDLDKSYNQQMEEAKTEIERLNNMLESYKQSIKKLQGQMSEGEI